MAAELTATVLGRWAQEWLVFQVSRWDDQSLSLGQLRILLLLAGTGPVNSGTIAIRLGTRTSNTSALIGNLQRAHLVNRYRLDVLGDQRITMVALTMRGSEIVDQYHNRAAQFIADRLSYAPYQGTLLMAEVVSQADEGFRQAKGL